MRKLYGLGYLGSLVMCASMAQRSSPSYPVERATSMSPALAAPYGKSKGNIPGSVRRKMARKGMST